MNADNSLNSETLTELTREAAIGAEGSEIARDIPVIDMRYFESRRNDIRDELWDAATTAGFFQLANHGISLQSVDYAFELSQQFFNLPESSKARYQLEGVSNVGWESRKQVRPSTGIVDEKESFQITRPNMENKWPGNGEVNQFKSTLLAFERNCWHLGMRVLSCFAEKLGFDLDFFSQAHTPDSPEYVSTLRLLHYFSLPDNTKGDVRWGAGAHTDFDCLTLLFQRDGQEGLQVCPGNDADSKAWTSVPARSDLITCNIGDMLMRWSDDQLKSTLHRVKMPSLQLGQNDRYSIAFFCQANNNQIIQGPLKKYPPITAKEYLRLRLSANFERDQ